MGPRARRGVIIKAAEGVQVRLDVGLRAVDLFRSQCVDAAEKRGPSGGRIKTEEGKLEDLPAGSSQEKIVGIEVAMNPTGGMERFHGVERLVDEKAPLVGIKRAGPDQPAERPAFKQLKNLVGAVEG